MNSKISSYRSENENLKKEMFQINKNLKDTESKLLDEIDNYARKAKDYDLVKKKYSKL